MSTDAKCAEIAASQFGVLSREQALAVGMSPSMIQWRLASRRWIEVQHRVYAIAGVPSSWEGHLMAACLSARGAVVSHAAAAAVWRLEGVKPGIVEVSRTKGLRRKDGLLVHRVRRLPEDQITRIGPIPVTTVARTLLDLSSVARRWTLNAAMDSALRKNLLSLDELRNIVVTEGERGRDGVRRFRAALAVRDPSIATPDSDLEREFLEFVERHRLPLPERQFRIEGPGFVAHADTCYPDDQLIVEVYGYAFHSGLEAFNHDADRMSELAALGWKVMIVTAQQMRRHPQKTAERLWRATPRSRSRQASRMSPALNSATAV